MKRLNELLVELSALSLNNLLEGILAILSCWLIYILMPSRWLRANRIHKRIKDWLMERNEKIYTPANLIIEDPFDVKLLYVKKRFLNVKNFTYWC